MDDPFLVGVLNGLADRREQFQPLVEVSSCCIVAKLRDRDPLDQFHHKVGPAGLSGTGVEYLGDVGMVHHRQSLPFGFKAGDDLPVSMPGLMIFSATLRRTGSTARPCRRRPCPLRRSVRAACRDRSKLQFARRCGSLGPGES